MKKIACGVKCSFEVLGQGMSSESMMTGVSGSGRGISLVKIDPVAST